MAAAAAATDERNDLVAIRLIGIPLDLLRRSQEHQDGVRREFALIAFSETDPPARLAELGEQLRAEFSGLTGAQQEQIDAALAAGRAEIDVEYELPASVREACIYLGALLDEVDEFCRHGALLALESPPEMVRFRRWFLGQFVDQVEGRPPAPWRQWREAP